MRPFLNQSWLTAFNTKNLLYYRLSKHTLSLMGYLLSRVVALFTLLLVLTFFSIALQKLRGGSASFAISGQAADNVEIQKIEKELGQKSFFFQFYDSFLNILTLKFGETVSHEPVLKQILFSFRYTLWLALLASLFSLIYGVTTGVAGHYFTSLRKFIAKLNTIFLASPIFIIAIIFIWIFSLALNLLPPGGVFLSGWYLLPALALGLKAGPRLSVFIDEYFEKELGKPYVTTHISYGINRFSLYYHLILKNIFLPALSFWLLDFSSYLAGAAIVETMHSIPGIGSLLIKALYSYDLNLTMGILYLTSMLIFMVAMIQDLLNGYYKRFTGEN